MKSKKIQIIGTINNNIQSVQIDATLTQVNQAADAKAVGDALALKADKTELDAKLNTKIDRSEIEEIDAIEIVANMGLVSPVVTEDGSIYTDSNGAVYSL